jgi:hypothetical protein
LLLFGSWSGIIQRTGDHVRDSADGARTGGVLRTPSRHVHPVERGL